MNSVKHKTISNLTNLIQGRPEICVMITFHVGA